MTATFNNFIDGQWVGSSNGKTFEQRNPANLDEVTGIWPSSTREDTLKVLQESKTFNN